MGLSWTGEKAYVGGSYGYDDTKYGIPFVEEGRVQLTPRRHTVSFRAGGRGFSGPFDSFRATLAHRRYRHAELEGNEVGTRFKNDSSELEVLAGHRAIRRMKGTIGV